MTEERLAASLRDRRPHAPPADVERPAQNTVVRAEEVVGKNVKTSRDVQLTSANAASVIGSAALLLGFAISFLSGVLSGASVITTTVFGVATAVMGGVLSSTLGRRLTLTDEYLESRDWLFRKARVPYDRVERIDFHHEHQLTIWISGGSTVAWPARTSGVEAFIGSLSERVTRVRPLQIGGDLEVE